jgi:hypothetical protein
MAEEFETVEIDISEEDILYYLVDEEGNEVGFVIEEDGEEVECYYEGYDSDDFELIGIHNNSEETEIEISLAELDGETVELEISEEDILYYLVDEDDNEIGFVIEEDGTEIECYYAEEDEDSDDDGSGAGNATNAPEPYIPEKAEDHGYLHKLAAIAGHEGNKARAKAEVKLDQVRGKAEVHVDKAKQVATETAGKAKAKAQENDLGITREGVKETTADLNAIAREGAETAKELKEAYDDIMENFGFLVPKSVRRKLP